MVSDRTAKFVLTVDRFALNVAQHWLAYVSLLLGIFVLLPFAAPALMALGATGLADAIYFLYGFLCHQLPQRSFFLFGHAGAKLSYSLEEIGRTFGSRDLLILRSFIGNNVLGWKVAWSDRMVAMFGSLWLGGLAFGVVRRYAEQSRATLLGPVAWMLLAIVPMGLDGFSHMINDAVAGFGGTGFRDTNAWLQILTVGIFPTSFSAGDAVGSFNNFARLLTGVLFGFSTVAFLYPLVDSAMQDAIRVTGMRLASPRADILGFRGSVDVTHG